MQKLLPVLGCSLALSAINVNATIIAPAAASIESVARTNTIDSPTIQQRTTGSAQVSSASQGTLVWTKGGDSYNMASTKSSATARTSLGVNKASVSATEMTPIRPGNVLDYNGTMNASAWSTAYASSSWNDWFYVGGTPGRGMQVTARGYLEFGSLFTSIDSNNATVPADIYFSAGGASKYFWSLRNFGTSNITIPDVLYWEHTFNVTSGQWFEFGSFLALNIGSQGGRLNHHHWSNEVKREVSGVVDSMHTTVFTGFEVLGEPAVAIQNSAGDLRKVDGKYTYEAAILEGLTPGNPAIVAAPSTILLSAMSLLFLLVRRRRELSV